MHSINFALEKILNDATISDPSEKISFNMRLAMVPSDPWIQVGKFIDVCYGARTFIVKVDPSGLSPGVYRGRVRAYDTVAGADKGSIFEIPVTVVQPHVIENSRFELSPIVGVH